MRPNILFLDDDPVIRVVRLVLSNAEGDPWIRDYFAPESVDLARLTRAARGLRQSDGVAISCMAVGDRGAPRDGASIIVFRRGTVTEELLGANPRLRLIQRLGERSVDIDVAAAAARGIWVSCLPRRRGVDAQRSGGTAAQLSCYGPARRRREAADFLLRAPTDRRRGRRARSARMRLTSTPPVRASIATRYVSRACSIDT